MTATTHILAEQIELLEDTLNTEKRTVDVVLIRPGWSANGRYYSPGVLAKAAPLFEGVKAYANHPTREQLRKGESRSVLDITGNYTNVHIGESGELRATRHVFGKAGEAVWPLIEQSVQQPKPIIGVSINALGKAGKGKLEGKEGIIVESIEIANSADDVDTPAAGGGFERLIMGDDNNLRNDLLQTMSYDEFIEARPDHVETLRKQMKRTRQTDEIRALTEERDALQRALSEQQAERDAQTTVVSELRADKARLQHQLVLEQALREAKFTQEYEVLIRKRLESAAPGDVLAIIAEERAKLRAAGVARPAVQVHGVPVRESVHVTANLATLHNAPLDMTVYDTPEKLAAAMRTRQHT